MKNPHEQLVQFILEKSANEPVEKRITLYSALKDICGDEAESAKLALIVHLLESAERNFRDLQLDFFKHISPEEQTGKQKRK